MDVTWPLVVMAAAVFVSMVLLAVVCLHCRNKGPQAYIRQANGSEESSEFRIVHHSQPTFDRCSSNLLSPYSDRTQGRQPSVIRTDTESNPSYENPTEEPDMNPESDAEDPGYIIVLPDGEAPNASQSRASTPSSDVQHDYVNIEIPSEKKKNSFHCPFASEDKDYLNVEPMSCKGGSTPELSATSDSNDEDDDDDDDDDDDEGNYVNVQDGLQNA